MIRTAVFPLILGASARAAADSCRRAGLRPWAGDLFADLDLARGCPARRVPPGRYPQGLRAIAEDAPAGPWIYTGALENHPDLVEQVSRDRPLWGNPAGVLRAVRDPLAVAAALDRAGLPCPRCRRSADSLPRDGRWLVKPLAGAAGRGIEPLRAATRRSGRVYFQERIDGLPHAAIFLADGRDAALVGVTRQLIGEPALHARPFAYCGSIGPIALDTPARVALGRLGSTLAGQFGLAGLFGVDLVLGQGTFWPVEINPRYTASVEVLDRGGGVPLMGLHQAVCEGGRLPAVPIAGAGSPVTAKAVLYAPEALRVPTAGWPPDCAEVADLPWPGQTIERGHPVLSVLAVADSPAGSWTRLQELAAQWLARFSRLTPGK